MRFMNWLCMLSMAISIPAFLLDPQSWVADWAGKISICAAYFMAIMSIAEELWPRLRS